MTYNKSNKSKKSQLQTLRRSQRFRGGNAYYPQQPYINIEQIITEAEKQICTALPKIIEKRTDDIVDKILSNLNKNIKEFYKPILNEFKEDIEKNMKNEMEAKIKEQYTEISKEFVEDIIKEHSAKSKINHTLFDQKDGNQTGGKNKTGKIRRNCMKPRTKRKWQY